MRKREARERGRGVGTFNEKPRGKAGEMKRMKGRKREARRDGNPKKVFGQGCYGGGPIACPHIYG